MQIAIIPARGGSKRIPRKSIRPFLGKPLIAYAIEACLQSGLFDHVLVSTDSEEFAAVAREHGAETPFLRPADLAGDYVATAPVVDHALDWATRHWGRPDRFCQLYANPFVTAENLAGGQALLRRERANVVLAVTTFAYPILRALALDETGGVGYAFPEYRESRSQDLPTFYHDAAQFYWHELADIPPDRTKPRNLPYLVPRHMAVDIDTEEDWTIAERLFQAFRQP